METPSFQAILLVDGYNIIGAWDYLSGLKEGSGLDSAREALIAHLANYSALKAYETWAVFDAYGQKTPACQEVITPYLSVHYTGFGQTADSYIEKACAKFRYDSRKFTQRLIVATSDSIHQQTAIGYGAEGMSALHLANEITGVTEHLRQQQKRPQSRPSRIFSSLSPEVQAQLAQLRHHKAQ